MKYVALIRGINVGRKNRIKMAELVNSLDSTGFNNIKTYLQSGNIIFEDKTFDISKIASVIENTINQTFGFSVNVIIRNEDELESIIESNPFINEPDIEFDKLYVTFLEKIPDKEHILNLDIKKGENEKLDFKGKEIYLYLPNGYSKTKLTNDIFEKKLNITTTTRNWKTVCKLLELTKI